LPDPTTILLFMLAALALNLTPGPDMLYVLTRSTTQGAAGGVAAATGGLAGSLIHTVFAVLGLSAILLSSATAFTAVKLLGAAYLVYLGLRALLGSRGSIRDRLRAGAPMPLRRIMWEAGVIHTLNPKVAIFFLAFLPQFVPGDAARPAGQLATLGAVFVVQAWAVNSLIALAAGRVTRTVMTRAWVASALDKLTGTIFLAFGVRLAAATAR
jgi:threonine/homoserine/homoserine lactone efflux protein